MFQKERKKFEMVQGYVFDIFLSNPFDFFYLCCLFRNNSTIKNGKERKRGTERKKKLLLLGYESQRERKIEIQSQRERVWQIDKKIAKEIERKEIQSK
jgi:hypothetical protein